MRVFRIPIRLVINGIAEVAVPNNGTAEDAEKKVRDLQFAGIMSSFSTMIAIRVNDSDIEFVGAAQERPNDFGFASADSNIPDPDHEGPS
jgi:hypothetical protein